MYRSRLTTATMNWRRLRPPAAEPFTAKIDGNEGVWQLSRKRLLRLYDGDDVIEVGEGYYRWC